MTKLIIFDLDNTLYDEMEFFKIAYRNIAKYLSEKYSINSEEIYNRLIDILRQEDPTFPIFDRLFKLYDIPKQKEISNILEIFYNSTEGLHLYEHAIEILKELSQKYDLILMTDGNPRLQNRKIKELGIEDFFEEVILVDEAYGKVHRKPSPVPLISITQEFDVNSSEVVFIGDNIFKDFISPNRLKMVSIRVLRGIYSKYPNEIVSYDMRPKLTIFSLKDLLKYF